MPISSGRTSPSSIARASNAAFVAAGRPARVYLIRARSTYCLTVCSLICIRRATDAFDIDWNHSSSASRSLSDSIGRSGRGSPTIAPASAGGTYGRSLAAASTVATQCSRPSCLARNATAPASSAASIVSGSVCSE